MLENHSQKEFDKVFSVEFFPPKTEQGLDNVINLAKDFMVINPEYYSVTFGAGGSTQAKTVETVLALKNAVSCSVTPHLSCITANKSEIEELLDIYKSNNVDRLVVLRGDLPAGCIPSTDFNYATDLIKFIRDTTGDYFHMEVAAYPECHPKSQGIATEIKYFKQKVELGANSALTQYFYNFDAYCHFIEECDKQNIKIPIVPGIMPIHDIKQVERFSDMCGAEFPRWMRKMLDGMSNADVVKYGIEIVSELCQKLLDFGAPGLHFYSLNKKDVTLAIWDNLKLN